MKHIHLLTGALVVAVACSDPFKPTTANVAGDYSLERLLIITDTGGTRDWRAAGSTFTISLTTGGTTTGHLFIPGGNEGGGDFSADMSGTWALSGDTVSFDQAADSFVRDYVWTARANHIVTDRSLPGLRVIVVLRK